MSINPLVSILIPAFNAESWISETLASALAQTWPRKEIIVVDDGSADRTLSVASQFSSKGVSVVTQPNQGAAAARNKAFSLSHGDYIQWLDADDLLAPDKISKQIEALKSGASRRTLLSSAWGHFLYRAHKARFCPSPLWADLTPLEWLLRKMEHDVHMQPATWLVSRELTEAAGPWDTRLLGDDDGEYFCRVLLASDGTRFVRTAETYYRITGSGSLSYIGGSSRKLEAQLLSCRLHIGYVLQLEASDRSRAACVKYLQKYLPMFHLQRSDLVEQVQHLAGTLGGRLDAPKLSWKYEWIHKLFGWAAARRTQLYYNRLKWTLIKAWDETLFRVEGRQQLGTGTRTGAG